jgi:hypothetical protein
MATLSILNNFTLDSNGRIKSGKQGLAANLATDVYAVTVNGTCHFVEGTLNTATVVTVYNTADDVPTTWVYLYFWADQKMYIQLIGTGSNSIRAVAAYEPFVQPGFNTILAAANTTGITGGAEPALTNIGSVILGNYSGNVANYFFGVMN